MTSLSLSPSLFFFWFPRQSTVLYCAPAWIHQCMGSQIPMEIKQNQIHQHNKTTFTITNSTVNLLVLYLPWWTMSIHCPWMHNFTQEKQTLPTSWCCTMRVLQYQMQKLQVYVVMYWDCFAIMSSAVANFSALYLACFAVMSSTVEVSILCLVWCTKWLCGHILTALTAHLRTALQEQKHILQTTWYCTMRVLQYPNETTVKHMVLYYTVLRFICNHETQQLQIYLVLYAACLAVTNSTINCSVLYLAWWTKWLWKLCPYSRCICCQNAQFLHKHRQKLPTCWYCTMRVLEYQVQEL